MKLSSLLRLEIEESRENSKSPISHLQASNLLDLHITLLKHFVLSLVVSAIQSKNKIRGLDFGGDSSSGSDEELFEDKNDYLYVVETGKIEVRVGPGRGRFIGKLLPGDCFGEVTIPSPIFLSTDCSIFPMFFF